MCKYTQKMQETKKMRILSTLIEKEFKLAGEDARNNFTRDFYILFPPRATLERFTYVFRVFCGYTEPETLKFDYADTATIWNL